MARRRFSREFKVSAARLVKEQGYTPAEAAKSLGVSSANIRHWAGKFAEEVGPPTGEGGLKLENQRLRTENAKLRMEREILKKAATFFAREQT